MELPGLKILCQLGESSMTEVWKAYQKSLRREVTIKILKDEFAAYEGEVERFCAEAKQTARLKHRRIVQIYDVVRHGGRQMLLMEYVAGPTVERVLKTKKRFASREAMRIAVGVAEALRYAWDGHRMIHRNLSPRSILLDTRLEPRLAYMGMSLRVDPTRPDEKFRPDTIEGTPYYMSPEQAQASPDLDCRTDMYGLGATLYQMITGVVPFGEFDPVDALRCQVKEKLRHPSEFVPRLPDGVSRVLEKLMMKHSKDRYPDWGDAIRAMRQGVKAKIIVRKGSGGARGRKPESTIAPAP
jgi:eukaryotic-like serine/threonine-protein kinase